MVHKDIQKINTRYNIFNLESILSRVQCPISLYSVLFSFVSGDMECCLVLCGTRCTRDFQYNMVSLPGLKNYSADKARFNVTPIGLWRGRSAINYTFGRDER